MRRKSSRRRKGDPYVRRPLCGPAYSASRTRCGLADKFMNLLVQPRRKRDIVALAHTLLKIVFIVIDRGDYYRDASTGCEATSVELNAPP